MCLLFPERLIADAGLPGVQILIELYLHRPNLPIPMAETNQSHNSKSGKVKVRLTSDMIQAYIKILPPEGEGAEATYEQAVEELSKAGVVHGIDESALQEALLFRKSDEEILIATGTHPENGKDGEIQYHYDPDYKVTPKEDEKGNVDYRELGLIRSVKKGTKLAAIKPPEPSGKGGINVKGVKIPAMEGKPVALPTGRNTMPHPENNQILIAAADGALFFQGPLIEIEPVYTVSGDVDFNTGNIEHVGSVMIRGDVKSGFKVKAGGDIDIAGVVEDAEIEAGGQVILQKGIVGRGNGIVRADGNVYLKYCENQRIYSKANIYVGEALLHSYVVADRTLFVKGKKGAIIGGIIFATLGIEVRNLGNYQHVKTDVTVGINEESQKKIEEKTANIKKTEENLANIKKAIQALAVQKAAGSLSTEKVALLDKLRDAVATIEKQIMQENAEKNRLESESEKYKDAKIFIYNNAYPGVHIRIQRDARFIKDEQSDVCCYLDDRLIAIKPNI